MKIDEFSVPDGDFNKEDRTLFCTFGFDIDIGEGTTIDGLMSITFSNYDKDAHYGPGSIIKLNEVAVDESTYLIKVSFYDVNDQPVSPVSVLWSLKDRDGNIINNRDNVSVSPEPEINILLTGDDIDYADTAFRRLHIDAVYNSDLGSNLPLRDCCNFNIKDC